MRNKYGALISTIFSLIVISLICFLLFGVPILLQRSYDEESLLKRHPAELLANGNKIWFVNVLMPPLEQRYVVEKGSESGYYEMWNNKGGSITDSQVAHFVYILKDENKATSYEILLREPSRVRVKYLK